MFALNLAELFCKLFSSGLLFQFDQIATAVVISGSHLEMIA